MNYCFSQHALEEMQRRAIPTDLVDAVLRNPEQVLTQASGTKVYQGTVDFGTGKRYLLRVFVNDSLDPVVVITVYRTSNITKYRNHP